MTQIAAKSDVLSELAEEHERLVVGAFEDGVITPQEKGRIIWSARRVKTASERQARRITLGTRMIRGGKLDRGIMQDVQDYQELCRQEEAAKQWRPLAA
jgi:hypothetical protein